MSTPDLSERTIQTIAVQTLRKLGFSVCVTSNGRKTANTHGTPDLFVSIKNYRWLGIEIKRKGGNIRPEQAKLAEAQKILVCDSVESIVQSVIKEGK